MKPLSIIISLLLCLYLTYCSFQTSLFKELNKEFIKKNLIFSPLSAYQILGLTANGAQGTTLKEMLLALGNKDLDELNTINTNILNKIQSFSSIEMANAVMTKNTLKSSFLNMASKYEATVETLKSVTQVNNWCNLKTHGTIPKILDSLPPNTVMALLNAIYFKGTWFKKFDKNKSYRTTFYNYNDETKPKKIEEMSITDNFKFYYDEEIQMVELPYMKDSMSAIIILPRKKVNINDFIANLDDGKLNSFIKKMETNTVQIDLPKFELDFSSSLIKALQNMGMKIPFTFNADFGGMIKNMDLKIEIVHQKSYLKVDEEGVTASSSTAVVIVKKGGLSPYSMIIDRPFLFMLRNSKLPQNYQMVIMSKIEEL